MSTDIVGVLQAVFGVAAGRIVYNPPAAPADDGGARRLQTAPYTATYFFFNDPTSTLPGPTDLVHSFAMTSELVTAFAAIGLNYDSTNNMAGTMTIYPNYRPTWIMQPVVDAQSHSINISLTTSTTGNLYAELVKDDATVLPSSRQVTMLVDAFGTPSDISYT